MIQLLSGMDGAADRGRVEFGRVDGGRVDVGREKSV